jgi:hypothetical protein
MHFLGLTFEDFSSTSNSAEKLDTGRNRDTWSPKEGLLGPRKGPHKA